MKPLLLTVGVSNHYDAMVKDHEARHQAYAEKWGYEYQQGDSSIARSDLFARLDYILTAMKSGQYSHVFWLDADCLVADFSHDMRETLPSWAWIALTIHPYPTELDTVHFQTGMMYYRSCQEAIDFLEEVVSQRHKGSDQGVMNEMFHIDPRWQAGLNILVYRWNHTLHDNPRDNSIVAAWHGACGPEERRTRMQRFAREHPYENQL